MEWIKIIDFNKHEVFEINKFYFLYDDAVITVKSPQGETSTIQISPSIGMYKGGGKFMSNNLEILLLEDFTHLCLFEPPKF